MIGGWVDQTAGDLLEVSEPCPHNEHHLTIQFLSRLDVVNSQVAEDALLSVFTTRPEIFDQVDFDGRSRRFHL
jgi:condensin complex subunit 3